MHVNASSVFRLVAVGLVMLLALGNGPAGAVSAARLGTATFDARRSIVYLPYTGAAPKFTLYKLSPTHFYYELQPARLTSGNVQFQAIGGAIERFTLANRPAPDVVRLSFQLNAGAQPVLRVDAAQHRLVVLPLGAERAHPLATLGVPRGWTLPAPPSTVTALGAPFIAGPPRRLVLPFKGGTPEFIATIYQRNPRWIIMDVLGADPQLDGENSGAFDDPVFEAWMLAKRPEPHHARFYLRLRHIVQVHASLGANHQEIWMTAARGSVPAPATPLGTPSPLPSPVPSLLLSPLPSPVPSLLLSPVPSPLPSPTPLPFLVPHGRVMPTEAPVASSPPMRDEPIRLPGVPSRPNRFTPQTPVVASPTKGL